MVLFLAHRGGTCAGSHSMLGLQEPGLLGNPSDGEQSEQTQPCSCCASWHIRRPDFSWIHQELWSSWDWLGSRGFSKYLGKSWALSQDFGMLQVADLSIVHFIALHHTKLHGPVCIQIWCLRKEWKKRLYFKCSWDLQSWDLYVHFMLSPVSLIWLKQNIILYMRILYGLEAGSWARNLDSDTVYASVDFFPSLRAPSVSTSLLSVNKQTKCTKKKKSIKRNLATVISRNLQETTENDSTQIPKGVVSDSTADASTESRCWETSCEGLKSN